MTKNPDRSQSDLTPEEQFSHQPHGAAGQPMNRPPGEGHEAVTPIQPAGQDTETGVSPTEAVTHGEPAQVVGTAYTTESGTGEGDTGRAGGHPTHRGSHREK